MNQTKKHNKEIGGYFGLEFHDGNEYWHMYPALNTGRNCLRQIVKELDVKKMYVPGYTCPVVWDVLKSENVEMLFYNIDMDFMPLEDFPTDEFVLYTNYLGVCSNQVKKLSQKHKKIIVDNTQSFFSGLMGVASFNSARKFFGVPDGAYLFGDIKVDEHMPSDNSFDRINHLAMRIDLNAQSGYALFQQTEKKFEEVGVKRMSALTHKMLASIDYTTVACKRTSNWLALHDKLKSINEWHGNLNELDVPMAYPFIIKSETLRRHLINNNVFVPTFWRNQLDSSTGKFLENYLLPLPVDQRYSPEDMEYISSLIINMV